MQAAIGIVPESKPEPFVVFRKFLRYPRPLVIRVWRIVVVFAWYKRPSWKERIDSIAYRRTPRP